MLYVSDASTIDFTSRYCEYLNKEWSTLLYGPRCSGKSMALTRLLVSNPDKFTIITSNLDTKHRMIQRINDFGLSSNPELQKAKGEIFSIEELPQIPLRALQGRHIIFDEFAQITTTNSIHALFMYSKVYDILISGISSPSSSMIDMSRRFIDIIVRFNHIGEEEIIRNRYPGRHPLENREFLDKELFIL